VDRNLCALFSFIALAASAFGGAISVVEQSATRPAEGIQDNSFLIEEAYNQGPEWCSTS
jgi:hypothetical protein